MMDGDGASTYLDPHMKEGVPLAEGGRSQEGIAVMSIAELWEDKKARARAKEAQNLLDGHDKKEDKRVQPVPPTPKRDPSRLVVNRKRKNIVPKFERGGQTNEHCDY